MGLPCGADWRYHGLESGIIRIALYDAYFALYPKGHEDRHGATFAQEFILVDGPNNRWVYPAIFSQSHRPRDRFIFLEKYSTWPRSILARNHHYPNQISLLLIMWGARNDDNWSRLASVRRAFGLIKVNPINLPHLQMANNRAHHKSNLRQMTAHHRSSSSGT